MLLTNQLDQIRDASSRMLPEITAIRRYLHAHPELSFEEKETSQFLAEQLTAAGIPFTRNWAGHGIVAEIRGEGSDWIALRGDMDALPIQELSDVPYKSVNEGVMHACGHDVHSACLLGAARILKAISEKVGLPVNVRYIFQPGEEKLPGGASLMIQEGVLQNPVPGAILAQHVYPSLEAGKVGIRPGLYMASTDEVYITIRGKGGHAAMPHECNDVVLAASHAVIALQQIASRHAPAAIPTVLSIGKYQTAGGATNVLPDVVHMEGTFRTMDESWRQQAYTLIQDIVNDTCRAFGCAAEVRVVRGYPCLVNEEKITMSVKSSMVEYLGEENVVDLPLRMTGEDFSFYSHHIPACFYRLGTRNEPRNLISPVHTPTFDIDEAALETGMGLLAWLAISCLPGGR